MRCTNSANLHHVVNGNPINMAKAAQAPGLDILVADRYDVDLKNPLGLGGMATVYRAHDRETRRYVALKTLRPEYREDPDSRRRFLQEARMMALVDHPHLVAIYDLVEEASAAWVVMELVPGQTLKQLVEANGAMSPEHVIPILEQLADALGQLHQKQLVHLDIKPQNIMLTPDGNVKVIDFGLTQPAGAHQDMISGTAFGTVAYLAPEQASGDAVDSSTDVYSLGCVIYELITGRPPFEAPPGTDQKQRLIRSHLEELPTAPSILIPELPGWIDDVIGWALAKSRRERFHDVATFARMFRSGIDGEMLPGAVAPVAQLAPAVQVDHTSVYDIPGHRPGRLKAPRPALAASEILEEPMSPGVLERVYRLGGRGIRRTRRLRKTMWKLILIFAIGNLLLGAIIAVRDGPETLVERFLSVAPGTETTVTVDRLNLRESPTAQSNALAVLPQGTTVYVLGLPRSNDEGRWWPVQVQAETGPLEGWLWDGGLDQNTWTGNLGWIEGGIDRLADARQRVDDWRNRIAGFWPF